MPDPIELLPPGTGPHDERWHELRRAGVTASEIAAVMGLSKWDSPFSLYWKKVNGWATEDSDVMSTGRHLEPSIADWWFAECDPLENVVPGRAGLYAHPERPWQLATPDRLIQLPCDWCDAAGERVDPRTGDYVDCQGCGGTAAAGPPIALLECKWVAHSWDGWGEQDTDDIPVYYRAQCQWQLDVLGVDEVFVAALGPGGFRAYRVQRDETDLKLMRAAGAAFHQRLVEQDPPDLDSHSATLGALKRLHPSVGDGEVSVTADLAEEYRQARTAKKAAEVRVDACEVLIRAALGSEFNRAVCNGKSVASRSVFDRKGFYVEPTTIDKLTPGRAESYAD